MRTVWKYQIPVTDDQIVKMPKRARILPYLECQGISGLRILTYWADVVSDNEKVGRHLHIAGTGHPVDGSLAYVGTARIDMFMWHLYDGGEV